MRATIRNIMVAAALGAATAPLAAAVVLPGLPQDTSTAVVIDNFTFNPQRITLKTGTTVTWTNRDDIPHALAASGKQFRSKALDTDNSFSFTFNAPGTYDYFCSLHPHMTGVVVVEATDGSAE